MSTRTKLKILKQLFIFFKDQSFFFCMLLPCHGHNVTSFLKSCASKSGLTAMVCKLRSRPLRLVSL